MENPCPKTSIPLILLDYCERRLNLPDHLPAFHSRQQVNAEQHKFAGVSLKNCRSFLLLLCEWLAVIFLHLALFFFSVIESAYKLRLKWLSSELQVWRPLVFPCDRCDRRNLLLLSKYPAKVLLRDVIEEACGSDYAPIWNTKNMFLFITYL